MDITKLPDHWRNDIGFLTHRNPAMICANQLENNLPVWTRITEDESTWPEKDSTVMLYGDGVASMRLFCSDFVMYEQAGEYCGVFIGKQWRDLIPGIDTPESES